MYQKAKYRSRGTGSITQNPSGTWKAQVALPSAPRISGEKGKLLRLTRSFRTRREAETWLHKQRTLIDGGLTAESHSMKLEEYGSQWLDDKRLEVGTGTIDDYERYCRLYIFPDLGHITLRNISSAIVSKYYSSLLARGIGGSTVSYVHRVLRAILSDAMRDGMISSNPCTYVKPPKVKKQRNVEVMSRSEISEFLKLAEKTPYAVLFKLALYTGMRLGELLGLTWRAINFSEGTIHVFQQIRTRHIKGSDRLPDRPKTESGVRFLPLGEDLWESLKEFYSLQQIQIHKAGSSWKKLDYVFASSVGTPLQPGLLQKAVKKTFHSMNLPNSFTFHNLRHTAASIMLSDGMALTEVSGYLGHSSPAITAQIYAHLIPGGLEKARKIQDKLSREFLDRT
jgi:integrase